MENVIKLPSSKKHNWLCELQSMRFIYIGWYFNKALRLIIDFSKITFMTPLMVTSLACFIEEYSMQGFRVSFTFSQNNIKIRNFLEQIRFNEYWSSSFDRTSYTNLTKDTSLCLWKINPSMIDSYVIRAQKYYEDKYLKSQSLYPFNIALGESINNIFDHSQSPVDGYTFTQYFPAIDKMRTSLCDFGNGIARTVKNHIGGEDLSDSEAITKAFEVGFSIMSRPNNRGQGLDNLQRNVYLCGGELNLYTNKVHLTVYSSGKFHYRSFVNSFTGTVIDIEFNTSQFDNHEPDHELDYLPF